MHCVGRRQRSFFTEHQRESYIPWVEDVERVGPGEKLTKRAIQRNGRRIEAPKDGQFSKVEDDRKKPLHTGQRNHPHSALRISVALAPPQARPAALHEWAGRETRETRARLFIAASALTRLVAATRTNIPAHTASVVPAPPCTVMSATVFQDHLRGDARVRRRLHQRPPRKLQPLPRRRRAPQCAQRS